MDPPARVAHLGPDPAGPGGMPAVVRDLLESPLAERFAMEAIPTYRTAAPLPRLRIFATSLVAVARWCRGPGPRLLHIHSAVRGSAYRKSAYVVVGVLARRPVLLHLHAGQGDIRNFVARLGPVRRAWLAGIYRCVDRLVSVSRAGADELERAFGRAALVVPNAAPRVPADRATPRSPDGGVRVLYLGGFADPAKGGTVLLEALAAIVRACPEADVTLAGPGEPPPGALDRLERVGWVGWVDGAVKEELFRRADLVVFPSISEGLPVALLEAMAYGRAIVATAVGGMPEVLDDGAEARFVPPADPGALARAVEGLAADPHAREALGRAARARAERLNAHDVGDRLEAIYRELLDAPRPRRRATISRATRRTKRALDGR